MISAGNSAGAVFINARVKRTAPADKATTSPTPCTMASATISPGEWARLASHQVCATFLMFPILLRTPTRNSKNHHSCLQRTTGLSKPQIHLFFIKTANFSAISVPYGQRCQPPGIGVLSCCQTHPSFSGARLCRGNRQTGCSGGAIVNQHIWLGQHFKRLHITKFHPAAIYTDPIGFERTKRAGQIFRRHPQN